MQQRVIKSIAVVFAGKPLPAGTADVTEAGIQRQGPRIGMLQQELADQEKGAA